MSPRSPAASVRSATFFNVNTSNLSPALKATCKMCSPKHLADYLGALSWTANHRRNMSGMIGEECSAAASSSRLYQLRDSHI